FVDNVPRLRSSNCGHAENQSEDRHLRSHDLETSAHRLEFGIASKIKRAKINHGIDSAGDNRANRRRQRYRGSDRLVFSAETCRSKFQGALPISPGKDAVVHCEPSTANISLFWLRRGRERFPFSSGLRTC